MNQNKINYTYEVVLCLLKEELHGRELAKRVGTSLTRVQGILNDLINKHIVEYTVRGRNHMYELTRNLFARSAILCAEYYALTRILYKHPELEPLFHDILSACKSPLIILFGSYSKRTEQERSDIDLYIETKDPSLKKSLERLHEKLNVKIGPFHESDILIQEIIKNHVILRGGERFYELQKFFN